MKVKYYQKILLILVICFLIIGISICLSFNNNNAFASTIVGYSAMAIGFKELFPQIDDPYTPAIFWMVMFLFIGIPIIGWIASLIAMKFYPLDQEKMIEVQAKIADMKKEALHK